MTPSREKHEIQGNMPTVQLSIFNTRRGDRGPGKEGGGTAVGLGGRKQPDRQFVRHPVKGQDNH